LRETYFPFSQAVSERGCNGQDSKQNYRLQGRWEFFYRNGQKRAEGTYRDGNAAGARSDSGIPEEGREGLWVEWYANGQKKSEGTYRGGKLEGIEIRWESTGEKLAQATVETTSQR
jgi:antitoxin component YwqK of YwqJK toxin-antitoxin module